MIRTARFTPWTLAVPVAAAALVFALPLGLEPAGRRALAIAVWMVSAWLLEPLHPMIVGFAGCFLFWAAGCVDFDEAFGGFRTQTPWFLYGALILVGAASRAGTIRELGGLVPRRIASSFAAAAGLIGILALAAGFLVPSAAARATITVVAALALSRRLDEAAAVKSRLPLVAVASYAAAVLGSDGSDAAPPLAWRLLAVCISIGVAVRFVRPDADRAPEELKEVETNWAIAVLLGLAVVGWATTAWHGLPPALIGLSAGLLAVFPGFRNRGETGPPLTDPLAVILAGTALSVPLVLEETKAAVAVTGALHAGVSMAASVVPTSVAAYWGYVAAALFEPGSIKNVAAGPALAASTSLSLTSLATIAACAAMTKLALYQSPALILGAAIGGFATRDILKFGIALAAAGAVAALLLSFA